MKQNEDHDDRKDQNDQNTILIAFRKEKGKRVSRAWLFFYYWIVLKNSFCLVPYCFISLISCH